MVVPDKVTVHPLVLLSVVDHYNRVAKDTKKRVVGLLLGSMHKKEVDITNSFALPFEEDENDTQIWYLDHSYLENMYRMFKKVNAREKIVGWYSSGPRLREGDNDINDLIAKFNDNPVLVICEVQPKELGLPIQAYFAKEEMREDGTQQAQMVFVNIPTEVGQTEAEEIGVEHLLRDVKDATISTLATEVGSKVQALQGLTQRLKEMQRYMELVLEGRLPVNHEIMYQVQDIFSLLPNMNVETLSKSLQVTCNDQMLVIYVSSLIRGILALHNLIENKEVRLWEEQAEKIKLSGKAQAAEKASEEKEKPKEDSKKST